MPKESTQLLPAIPVRQFEDQQIGWAIRKILEYFPVVSFIPGDVGVLIAFRAARILAIDPAPHGR